MLQPNPITVRARALVSLGLLGGAWLAACGSDAAKEDEPTMTSSSSGSGSSSASGNQGGPCANDTDCAEAGGVCDPQTKSCVECRTNTECASRPGTVCAASACVCAPGFGDCDQNPSNGCEADLALDPEHCGSCGNACGSGKTCIDQICTVCPGKLGPSQTYYATNNPTVVRTCDFDGDARLDLVVGNNLYGVALLRGNGDGTFQTTVTTNSPQSPAALVVKDFNNDGHLDVAAASPDFNEVSIVLGNGTGYLGTPITVKLVGKKPIALTASDFNGDGKLDLATANYNDDTVSVLLGNGDGTLKPMTPFKGGDVLSAIASGDFNGDGKVDLAVQDYYLTTPQIFLGSGDGTFFPYGSPATTTSGLSGLETADLNGDGKLDLATTNENFDSLGVHLGNGDGTFTQAGTDLACGPGPTHLTVADIDGDGKVDIATANAQASSVSLFMGDGLGTFTKTKVDHMAEKGSLWIASGDFDSDGKVDAATANYDDDTISVFLNATCE